MPPTTTGYIASANPADNTPHAQNGEARAFAEIGTTIYVGGNFTQVKAAGGSYESRSYLFAYNRTTGALSTTFLPVLDGVVNALAVTPDGKLIAGGTFRNVNGVERRQLVALDPVTGQIVTSWVGRSDGGVIRTAVVRGNYLYVGGGFQWINGTAHSRLARLDATTGQVDQTFQVDISGSRDGGTTPPLIWTLDVSPDGSTLVAGGNFLSVNGASRNQIVMVEDLLGTPTVAAWHTDRFVAGCYSSAFPYYLQSIDFADNGSYFVVGTNGGRDTAGFAYCDAITRWDTAVRGTNLAATWVNFTGTDTVTSVLATDEVIYTGGHFRWLNNANGNDRKGNGGIDRLGIGALDPSNGMPVNWNPRRSGAPDGTTAWGSTVPVLWRGSTGVYFGHNSDGMGGEYHGRMGMFPLSGGRTIPVNNPPVAPGYLHVGSAANQTTRYDFDGSALGASTVVSQPNLTVGGVAMTAGNKLYWVNGSEFSISMFTASIAGAPWTVGFNSWYNMSSLQGATFKDGRMYYTRTGSNNLFYRYLESDGYYIGCTEFVLPTTGMLWTGVRGLALVGDNLYFGGLDGSLKAVPFDATATTGGFAVNGANVVVVAPPGSGFTSPTLFFASS